MKNLFASVVAAAALLLAGAPSAPAQTVAPEAAHAGPRFPGGPDSLRALVARATGLVAPQPVGRALVQQAIRNREQDQVGAYFEVAENSAIEHPALMSTAGNALDTEVRRVMQTLPAAPAPALLRAQPVRVYYVLPLTFRVL